MISGLCRGKRHRRTRDRFLHIVTGMQAKEEIEVIHMAETAPPVQLSRGIEHNSLPSGPNDIILQLVKCIRIAHCSLREQIVCVHLACVKSVTLLCHQVAHDTNVTFVPCDELSKSLA